MADKASGQSVGQQSHALQLQYVIISEKIQQRSPLTVTSQPSEDTKLELKLTLIRSRE